MNKKIILCLATVFAFSVASQALSDEPLYKWKDAEGVVHFTQTPPLGDIPYTILNVKVQSVIPAPKYKADGTKADEEEEEKAQSPEAQAFNQARKKNCELAKSNLKTLKERARIRLRGKDGEYVILTDEEKHAKIALTETQVETFCGSEKAP